MNTDRHQTFNPFESRVCRDVRNHLGQSFLAALPNGNMEPVLKDARRVAPADADDVISAYVDTRVERYRAVLTTIRSADTPFPDAWVIALLLWDQELFFECHEWLEMTWRRREGAEKKMIQALILAAGAYSHLSYGRADQARKLAARAVAGLTRYRELVPGLFDLDMLVRKLESLDSVPPKFGPPGSASSAFSGS